MPRVMSAGPRLDQLARLLGDRSRAEIVSALMDGRQWTGRELARIAHVTPSTASFHLQRLTEGGIVSALAHGRHKYFRIGASDVARAIETLMNFAPQSVARRADDRAIDVRLRRLRRCYDHLAGEVAVALADSLIARGAVRVTDTAASVTPMGVAFFAERGIALGTDPNGRPACRPCLDWSERRYHLAGRLGAALARHVIDEGWVARDPDSRALTMTERGALALRASFGIVAS